MDDVRALCAISTAVQWTVCAVMGANVVPDFGAHWASRDEGEAKVETGVSSMS